MKFILLLLLYLYSYSQVTFIVHRAKTDGNKISQLEELIIRNTISLYNKNNSDSLKLAFENHQTFSEILTVLADNEGVDSVHVVMNSLTITERRKKKNMFSSPYLPVKNVLITTEKHIFPSDKLRKIGFIEKSIQEEVALKNPNATYTYIGFKSYKAMEKALFDSSLDFMITDNVDAWNNESLIIYDVLSEQIGSGYGIMFSKPSVYQNKLEKYFRYFLKSSKFKTKIYTLYGKEIADYFTKELRLM